MKLSSGLKFGIAISMAATLAKADLWGSAWSLGPTHNGAAVMKATTHIQPGAVPTPNKDILALWIGISNATSGLIQAGCDNVANMASISESSMDNDLPTGPEESDQQTWVHTVSKNGAVISTLQTFDRPLLQGGFGTANCGGSVSTQTYTNTTVVLSKADPLFSSTLGVSAGVQASQLTTADSGKTWTVASIKIPPMTINSDLGPNTGKPAICGAATMPPATTTTRKTTGTGGGSTGCVYGVHSVRIALYLQVLEQL
ncbi:hypothetical protein DFH08DRAFT_1055378 [Mycena albidolilacea]|uniref:Uncharacterized protein n=1 Tax=Mycena albidolilacea TaxID=1033008 RepID=A0AAD6Z2W0_9AGAR|nr:hypothetical protein DFH08DRAFT_1055378 [Mycena albidolilacea]